MNKTKQDTVHRSYLSYLICRIRRLFSRHALRYTHLYSIIREKKPRTILEIGVHTGENAVRMLTINPGQPQEYYGFDLFEDMSEDTFEREVAIQPLAEHTVKDKLENRTNAKIHLYKCDTTTIDDAFLAKLPKMDLIFVDGGHSIETQRNDWIIATKLLAKNGTIIVDDFWNLEDSGCAFLLNRIDRSKYTVKVLPRTDLYKKEWGILSTQFLMVKKRLTTQEDRHEPVRVRDAAVGRYEKKHTEIFNPVEQQRIRAVIQDMVYQKSNTDVLDIGAGTGNLALKFLEKGCTVTACDVSEKTLELLQHKVAGNAKLHTALLQNPSLPFPDNTFDIVCTYSVLHHVPDYMTMICEMARVTKPGGLVYIDHEFNDNKWNDHPALLEYYAQTTEPVMKKTMRLLREGELFRWGFIKSSFLKRTVNPYYQSEGDIHVWKHDHVEWKKILDFLMLQGFTVVRNTDYLLYSTHATKRVHDAYAQRCSDMKTMVVQKS